MFLHDILSFLSLQKMIHNNHWQILIVRLQKNARNQNLLLSQLNRVLNFAQKNREVCEDSIVKINNTINLINELQVRLHSVYISNNWTKRLLLCENASIVSLLDE